MTERLTYEELENNYRELEEENRMLRQAEESSQIKEDRLRQLIEHSNDFFEEILRLSEEKFSRAFHSSPNLMAISTLKEGRFIDVNESFIRINGYSREEIIGRTSKELDTFVHPEDREIIIHMLDEHGIVRNYEFDMRIKSGEVRKGSFSADRIQIDGQPCLISGVDDITERKRAEDSLRESEERYRNLFEKSPVAMSLTTLDGKLIAGNKSMEDMTGYTLEELKRRDLVDLYSNPEDRKILFNKVNLDGIITNYPVQLKRKDGEVIDVHLTISRVSRARNDALFQTIGIDMTERVKIEKEKERLEDQLQQSRRMDAIATLAGGIAHQFNNSLSTIIGNIELLAMDLSDNESIPKYIKPMKESVYRMTDLTDQLLAYARGGKYQPKVFLLTDFVRNTLPLLEHTVKSSVHIETDLPNDILHVMADVTQIQMAMSAIISNASEAIEEKGRIIVSCNNLMITDETVKDYSGLKPGRYVSLSIEDDGKGMDENIKNRVFEPFFSTKFHGRGLEMAAVYGIMKNHNGWISIESEKNKGTKTVIYLPAYLGPVKEEEVTANELVKGAETVMVIEDEETVMDVSKAMLERLGYRVLQAKTGDEAFHVAKQFDGKIDVALLDIVLPDMDGKAIYPLLKDIRPDIKVIVCSGYSSDGPAQEILNAGAQAFIQKPFSINKLSENLRTVLNMN